MKQLTIIFNQSNPLINKLEFLGKFVLYEQVSHIQKLHNEIFLGTFSIYILFLFFNKMISPYSHTHLKNRGLYFFLAFNIFF